MLVGNKTRRYKNFRIRTRSSAAREKSSMAILLGFDTGGTYTDAVIYDEDDGVLASAKSLTTKADLSIGLGQALGQLPEDKVNAARLVSVSTTLATNAMVEAHATPAALIIIGQDERALDRAGLGALVGDGPVAFVDGGHSGTGKENAPLDEAAVKAAIEKFGPSVQAFAVAGYFSVRNPDHENRVRDMVRDMSGLPVTCSHELTSSLDAPRRALTTLINARLIPLLQGLILSVQGLMDDRGIDAPLMVVRGDGSLISAQSALERPVETILSGPAASAIGASHLSGCDNGVVSDMGGTTTDVVLFDGGRPTISRDGAMVGGWRTMVAAVNVRTYGLGGDSEVRLSTDGNANLILGPRRVVPLSLLAQQNPEILDIMTAQCERPVTTALDGKFGILLRDTKMVSDPAGRAPNKTEVSIIEVLRQGPAPLHKLTTFGMGEKVLERLVNEGRVVLSSFTPSDAAHVLGKQDTWDAEGANLGARLFVRRLFDLGFYETAQDGEEFAGLVFERAIVDSAKTVSGAVLAEHYGVEPEPNSSLARFLAERSVCDRTRPEHADEAMSFAVNLNRPLLAIGAPAATYYGGENGAAKRLNADLVPLPHADVANAVGAVVGSVTGDATALITEPDPGLFRVHTDAGVQDFGSLKAANSHAEAMIVDLAKTRAIERGASETDTSIARDEIIVDVGGGATVFVESKLVATARGRPDLGV
jgi:N-methylhydantoinase A/oxoprolinase/acetone carboxylase beta subunit